ncbi:MAG: hypothetical protein WC023_01540 [Rhodocyclaceae bacterium]
MADEQKVTTSTRLWSEEVGIAAASDPLAAGDPNKEPGYEFSNGRTFFTGGGPYDQPAE